MLHNNDFRYDLEIGKVGESLVASLFSSKKIEVKTDSWTDKTGNIAVEFESRGKKSGIAHTEADWWAFVLDGEHKKEIIIFIETNRLKRIARHYFTQGNVKEMGDSNTSKAVLIPIKELNGTTF